MDLCSDGQKVQSYNTLQILKYNFIVKTLIVFRFGYLGATLDEHLLWNVDIQLICNKVSKRLG